jgi:hypothetical protein
MTPVSYYHSGKWLMVVGAMVLLASAVVFEWATFSRLTNDYRIVPPVLIAGLAGLAIWLAGCVLVCRVASGPGLFGGGVMMLVVLFLGGGLLDRFSPAVTNVQIGVAGIFAPMAACFLGGIMFIFVAIVRLGAN